MDRFDDFYRLFIFRLVRLLARRYYLDERDCEELAHEALVAAWRRGIDRQPGRDPWPWLTRVLENQVASLLRQRYRRRRHLIPGGEEVLGQIAAAGGGASWDWVADLADRGFTPSGQRAELLQACAESVRELGEVAPEYVCARLGLSRPAYHVAMSRLRAWLRDESGWSAYAAELDTLRAVLAEEGYRGFDWSFLRELPGGGGQEGAGVLGYCWGETWHAVAEAHRRWRHSGGTADLMVHWWMVVFARCLARRADADHAGRPRPALGGGCPEVRIQGFPESLRRLVRQRSGWRRTPGGMEVPPPWRASSN